MKKSPSDYTAGEQKYLARQQAVKAGKPNGHSYLKNSAVTLAGDFIIGLSYHRELERYSCSAIETDGIRRNDPCRWSKDGKSLDIDISDLNVKSIHIDVNTI